MSPGSVTERIHFFIGHYEPGDRVDDGGGLAEEGEDIEVLELGFDEAIAMIGRQRRYRRWQDHHAVAISSTTADESSSSRLKS